MTQEIIFDIFKDGVPVADGVEKTIEQIARANFSKWNAALQTGDSQQVAGLYANDATFLPTLSEEFKRGYNGIEAYFTHFLQKKPVCEIIEEEIQPLGSNSYLHSGLYNFSIGPNDNRQVVEARFSFVWKQNDQDEWKIIHHHSSVKP